MSSFLLFLVACISGTWSLSPDAIENATVHFEEFIKVHRRFYDDETERKNRFQIFIDNVKEVIRLNHENGANIFGITQFMDLTPQEFLERHTGLRINSKDYHNSCPYLTDKDIQDSGAPEAFDWREQNVVTPVKNQGNCACCFSFSSMGAIESQYAIKHGQTLDLSEQQIVDCDKKDNGCRGGFMANVFRYLIEQGGVVGEQVYPYQARQGRCQFNPGRVQVKVASCNSYRLQSQEKLKQLLHQYGPVTIGVRSSSLKYLRPGSIATDRTCTGDVDHAVLLVGYGTENGMPYWIVKNSWGPNWGEKGFFRMQRGENAQSCGMMNDAMATVQIA